MRLILLLLTIFPVIACTIGLPNDKASKIIDSDKIVLRVYRKGWINFLTRRLLYAVSADGSGEIAENYPLDLGDEPAWSPDGQWIVNVTKYDYGFGAKTNLDIWVMRSDGSKRMRLTKEQGDYRSPKWSPDSQKIVYFGRQDNQPAGIYILDIKCVLRDETCKPQATFLVDGFEPDWSPDGTQIAYWGLRSVDDRGIFIIKADGTGEPRLLGGAKNCENPQWSPAGQKIAFDCEGGIYVMDGDGTNVQRLSMGNYEDRKPLWSPDGKKIVFVSSREGLGKVLLDQGEIWLPSTGLFIMNSDGSGVIRLTKRNDEAVFWYAWVRTSGKERKVY